MVPERKHNDTKLMDIVEAFPHGGNREVTWERITDRETSEIKKALRIFTNGTYDPKTFLLDGSPSAVGGALKVIKAKCDCLLSHLSR